MCSVTTTIIGRIVITRLRANQADGQKNWLPADNRTQVDKRAQQDVVGAELLATTDKAGENSTILQHDVIHTR